MSLVGTRPPTVGSFVGSIIVYKRSVNRECKLETLRKLTELRMKYTLVVLLAINYFCLAFPVCFFAY